MNLLFESKFPTYVLLSFTALAARKSTVRITCGETHKSQAPDPKL